MINRPAAPPDRAIVIQPQHRGVAGPPVHSLSALVTIVLDFTWGTFDFSIVAIPFVSLITGFLCFFAVFSIQKFVARDGWGGSFAKAKCHGDSGRNALYGGGNCGRHGSARVGGRQ